MFDTILTIGAGFIILKLLSGVKKPSAGTDTVSTPKSGPIPSDILHRPAITRLPGETDEQFRARQLSTFTYLNGVIR